VTVEEEGPVVSGRECSLPDCDVDVDSSTSGLAKRREVLENNEGGRGCRATKVGLPLALFDPSERRCRLLTLMDTAGDHDRGWSRCESDGMDAGIG
jgi:hypothetical protein